MEFCKPQIEQTRPELQAIWLILFLHFPWQKCGSFSSDKKCNLAFPSYHSLAGQKTKSQDSTPNSLLSVVKSSLRECLRHLCQPSMTVNLKPNVLHNNILAKCHRGIEAGRKIQITTSSALACNNTELDDQGWQFNAFKRVEAWDRTGKRSPTLGTLMLGKMRQNACGFSGN